MNETHLKKYVLSSAINFKRAIVLAAILGIVGGTLKPASAQVRIGYVHSQKVLDSFKEAQDVQIQLAELNKTWEEEARQMQRELASKQDELEVQAKLLSDTERREKENEIQSLYLQLKQFQQEKWGSQGTIYKEQARLMKPIYDKINKVIKKIGDREQFDYILDIAGGNIILYVSERQIELTDLVLQELDKLNSE